MVNLMCIISLVKPLVTDQMNEDLCKSFFEQEIGDALFQMGFLQGFFKEIGVCLRRILFVPSNNSLYLEIYLMG